MFKIIYLFKMKSNLTKDDILFFYEKASYSSSQSLFSKEALEYKDLLISQESLAPTLSETQKKKINFSQSFEKPFYKPTPTINRSSNYQNNNEGFFDNFEGKVDKSKLNIFKRNIEMKISSQNSLCIAKNKFFDVKNKKEEFDHEICSKIISVDDLFTKGEEALSKDNDGDEDKNLSTDPKIVEIKRIFKINEYLKVEHKKPLWYIYHTAGKSSFGPLTSENIEQMYNTKMLNGESDVRLIDVYAIDEGEGFKYFKLKEIEKSNFIKRICLSKQVRNALDNFTKLKK